MVRLESQLNHNKTNGQEPVYQALVVLVVPAGFWLFLELKMGKTCSVCHLLKIISEFNIRPDRPSGYRSECKRCQYDRQYRRIRLNRQKDRAKHAARIATKKGKIKKPLFCESCGQNRKLERHHPDYDKPLEVDWLCHRCHSYIHRYLKIA